MDITNSLAEKAKDKFNALIETIKEKEENKIMLLEYVFDIIEGLEKLLIKIK